MATGDNWADRQMISSKQWDDTVKRAKSIGYSDLTDELSEGGAGVFIDDELKRISKNLHYLLDVAMTLLCQHRSWKNWCRVDSIIKMIRQEKMSEPTGPRTHA